MPDGSPFPARNLAIFLAAAVILLSLVVASIGLPRVLKGLELPSEPAEQQQEDRARIAAANAAIESIKKAQHEIQEHTPAAATDLCTDAASRVIAIYQNRVRGSDNGDADARRLRKADAVERKLRLAGLRGERAEVLNLARHRKISDETSRKLVHEIDLVEAIYR